MQKIKSKDAVELEISRGLKTPLISKGFELQIHKYCSYLTYRV